MSSKNLQYPELSHYLAGEGMALYPCAVPLCANKALVGPLDIYTACSACGLRFCGMHSDDPFRHRCARRDKERNDDFEWIQRLKLGLAAKEKIDIPFCLAEAMALRPGFTCTGPARLVRDMDHYMTPDDEVTIFEGSYHWNFFITFDDGVKWVVRMAQIDHTLPPLPALRVTAASEFATLRALSEAGIKVPRVWPSKALAPAHIGLPYFFTEFIDGSFYEPFVVRDSRTDPPSEVDEQHIRALAQFYIGLSAVTFDSVGSLHVDDGGSISVGPVVAPTAMLSLPPWFLGPFPTVRDFYLAHIDLVLEQTIAGIRYPAREAIDGYIIYKVLRKLIETSTDLGAGPWYIRAVDDKGDRYFFAEGTLTGVIDWEWAFLTCKEEAFAAPFCLVHPDYHIGSNEIGAWEVSLASAYEELGRSDLAQCVRSGKKYQRLRDLLETDNHQPSRLYALYRAFIETSVSSGDPEPQSVTEWAGLAARHFPDLALPDEHLQVLRYRAALASYLPGTRVPEDSDSENEDHCDAESRWDSASDHSRGSECVEGAAKPESISNRGESVEDCPSD